MKPKLEWRQHPWPSGRIDLECVIATQFILRLEAVKDSPGCFRVAVIGPRRCALYRSIRLFAEDAAKAEAIKAGRREARRIAKTHTEIADLLRRAA